MSIRKVVVVALLAFGVGFLTGDELRKKSMLESHFLVPRPDGFAGEWTAKSAAISLQRAKDAWEAAGWPLE